MDSLRVQWVIPTGWRFFSRHEYSGFVHGALGRSVLFRGCGGEHRSLITLLTNSSQGRGCRHGNEVAGTSSILLVFFSQRCQGRLRCGTVRTLTGTHLWHTNAQTSARSGSSQHDYMTPVFSDAEHVCWRTNRKGKRCYFTARASGLCYDCGSTNPHTLILCTTLLYLWGRTTATVKPITAMKCELVILKITDLYTVVRFIPIQCKCATHYSKLCGQYRLHHLPRLQTH